MRLRASKTDMEAAGEDTDGMAESVSKLRSELLALSGVDIMIDDETYKTPYQMLIEMGKVWDDLNDITQANITELLFGKRQANIGSSILQNVELAESILETANNAEGSALRENEIYLDSVNGKLSKISATWQTLSQDTLDTDLVKGVLDFLNDALKFLDGIVEYLGSMPILISAIVSSLAPLKITDISNAKSALVDTRNVKNTASSVVAPFTRLWSTHKGSSGYSIYDAEQYAAIDAWNAKIKENSEINQEWLNNFHDTYDAAINKSKELHDTIETVTTATERQSIEVKAAGQGWVVYGSGIKGAVTAVKTFAVSLVPVLLQMFAISAAIRLLSITFELLEHKIHEDKYIREDAASAAEALSTVQSEIASINDELQTTQDRIDELKSKGSLTLTEQDELKRLQQQNAELETQLAIQQAIEKTKKEEAAQSAFKALQTYEKDDVVTTGEKQAKTQHLSVAERLQKYSTQYTSNRRLASQVYAGDPSAEASIASYNRNADEAKAKWAEIAEATQQYVSDMREFWGSLSADQQSYVEETEKALIQTSFILGTMSFDSAFKALAGDEAFTQFETKIKQMAANGQSVGDDLATVFGEDVAGALELLGYTADEVNEHIKAITSIGDIIDTKTTEEQRAKISEIVNDKDFAITAENIKEQFGDPFIKMLEDSGASVEAFCKYLTQLREALDNIEISAATGDLETAEAGIDAIGEAINKFRDNEGKVDASTLNGLSESLAAIADTAEFEKFINVLGNAKSTTTELNTALNNLIDKYFDTQIALGNLTDENIDLYTAQLKQMGVINAENLVRVKLAKNILNDANATDEAKEKAYELVNALDAEEAGLYNTANSALTSEQCLNILRIQCELIKNNGDFTQTIDNNAAAIVALDGVAGQSAVNLVEYAKILQRIAELEEQFKNGELGDVSNSDFNRTISGLKASASRLAADAKKEWEELRTADINTDVDLRVDPSESSSKGDTKADKNKDAYDEAKKKLDHQLEMNKITYDKYYKELVKLGNKYLKKEKDNAADLREHYETLADARRDAFEDGKEKLDLQLENGTISIEKYYTQVEKLMKKWYKGRKSNADDYAQAEIDLQKQIADAWSDRISDQETLFDRLTLEKAWPEGKSELDYWLDQMEDLQKQYRKGMWKDKEAYLKVYYELLEKIQNAEKELAQKKLDEVTKQIESIDDLVEMTSKMLKQRIEDEIDALEDLKNLYSSITEEKKKSLELTKDQLSYEKEITELNEDLTDLQAQAELLKLDTSRAGRAQYAELMSQIREKQNEISEKQSEHTYDATVDALDEADEKYQEHIENRIDALNKMMENQGEWLRYVYSYIESTNPSQLLSELKAYNYKYGDGINQTVDRIWNAYEKYADSVYGSSGYLVQILDELRNLELKYEKEVEDAEDAADDPYPSDNAASNLKQALKHKNLEKNTDAQNHALARQVEAEYGGNWYYDTKNQNIYSRDYDNEYLVSATAYPFIEKMKSINNNSSLSQAERKKQLEAQLKSLKTYYGYMNAHLVEGKNGKYHLYKTAGKNVKWQIFHDGIGAGYAGADYVPTAKQNELLALLQKGELIFNKENQNHLLSQLQSIENFQKAFKGLTGSSISQNSYTSSPVSVGGVTINVYGNANQDTVKALRKEAENISNMTLDKLQTAMQQKGYASGAARGTFKR